MFGYIRICKDAMTEEEFTLFRSYYCGLCKEIGHTSNIARLGLSYDMTFLLVLLSAIADEDDNFEKSMCLLHPFRKEIIAGHNRCLEYVADMSIILAYKKFEDDIKDEYSLKAFSGKIMYLNAYKRIGKKYPDTESKISEYLHRLSCLEKDNCPNPDMAADAFAKICELLFTPNCIEDKSQKKALGWLGYNVGRWIYLIDAFDDIEKDIRKKSYNPYIIKMKNKGINKDDIAREAESTLTYTLANISAAYDLLDIKRNDNILKNIIYIGMEGVQNKVLNLQEEINESL